MPGVAFESLRDVVVRQTACRIAAEREQGPQARPGIPNELPPKREDPGFFNSVGDMMSSVTLIGALSRMSGDLPRNWQDDPTFDMGDFLTAYPDQLAVIQPLLDRADPTSPVLDHALETLIDARSEGEARHVISQIAESQRRLESAFGNTAGAITGLGLGLAIDGLLLASLGGGLVSLV